MIILGIETTSKVGSVALGDDQGDLLELNFPGKMTHSEQILPVIDKLLKRKKYKIQEIDGIAVSIGPGSFTGVRIGVTTARTLAQILNKPLVGVATLDSLAYRILPSKFIVCPMINALGNEVYTALYQKGNKLQKIMDDQVLSIEKLLTKIKKKCNRVMFVGETQEIYRELITKRLENKAVFTPLNLGHPRAGVIAQLGEQLLKTSRTMSWQKIFPLYIKRAEAEIRWEEKYGCKN